MELTKITILFCFAILAVVKSQSDLRAKAAVVTVKNGKLEGKTVKSQNFVYYAFKGIPYAQPPIGYLRFQAPIPFNNWKGTKKALKHGDFCLNRFGIRGISGTKGGSENCLFLNVYTPSLDGSKAVMFWVHGGAFVSGSGNSNAYGPTYLVKEGVVLVTVNYRLSAFGFLSTGDSNAPGNQGLKDIVLALKWVQENIKSFGGDPKKVTIFGQSAGSIAINYLLLSNSADGLFSQAIMQSSSALTASCFQPDPMAQANKLATRLNLTYTNTKDLIQKLTAIKAKKIVSVEVDVATMGLPIGMQPFEFVPTAEPKDTKDAIITEHPILRLISGQFSKIPIIIGNTNFESMYLSVIYNTNSTLLSLINSSPLFMLPVTFGVDPKSPQAMALIKDIQKIYFNGKSQGTLMEWLQFFNDEIFRGTQDRVARFYAIASVAPIYYYEFSFDGALNLYKKMYNLTYEGASHSDDLLYLFDPVIYPFKVDQRSAMMRSQMVTMWTNFAKFGNPTPEKNSLLPETWMPYTAAKRSYFVINDTMANRDNPPRMDTLSSLYQTYTGHF